MHQNAQDQGEHAEGEDLACIAARCVQHPQSTQSASSITQISNQQRYSQNGQVVGITRKSMRRGRMQA